MSFEDRAIITTTDTIVSEDVPLIIGAELNYRPLRTTYFIIIHILLVVNINMIH